MKRKNVTREKLVRIIKRRDTQKLFSIHEDQFDWEVLKETLWLPICDVDEVVTLLEWIVYMGYVFKKEENLKRVVDDTGRTVAHIMAREGYEFDPDKDADLLGLADNNGWTVAHEMAYQGYRFDPDKHRKILLFTDSAGSTVAHVMAKRGYPFDPSKHEEICELKNEEGYSVLECFILDRLRFIIFDDIDQDLMEPFSEFDNINQDLMKLSPESIEKYMRVAEKLDRDVYEYLKKIFKIKKKAKKLKGELENVLGSLGLKL